MAKSITEAAAKAWKSGTYATGKRAQTPTASPAASKDFAPAAAWDDWPRGASPSDGRIAPPTSEEVSGLAQSGDRDAQEIIDLNARGVGDACAMLGDMLSPDVILLGSLARYLGMSWIEKIRARFAAECLASNAKSCRIEPAGLGERLQDCSALVVAVAGE